MRPEAAPEQVGMNATDALAAGRWEEQKITIGGRLEGHPLTAQR